MAGLLKQVRTSIFLCLFVLLAAFVFLAAPDRTKAATSFDGINGMRKGYTSAYYLQNWGVPDLFCTSRLAARPLKAKRERVDLWIYCKQGVQIEFEDGRPVREFLFDPKDGEGILPQGQKLNPDDFFNEPVSPEEIKKKFGEPQKEKASKIAGQSLLVFEYNQGRNMTFGFTNGNLTLASFGLKKGMSNPWCAAQSKNHASDPQKILGTWKSSFGEVTFKQAPYNKQEIEGQLVAGNADPRRFSGVGIISKGSFNKDTNFLKFAFRTDQTNIDGHAELFLSQDGKTLSGIMSSVNEWDCWPWQLEKR